MESKNEIKIGIGGFLLFIDISMFLSCALNLFAGLFAIRNVGLFYSIESFLFGILCLITGILIIKKKRISKRFVFVLEVLQIISNIVIIISSLLSGDISRAYPFFMRTLFAFVVIMYFIQSKRVQNTLVK